MSVAYQIFSLPKASPVTPSTVVLPGAKAYFYLTGTTTLQNTYSDSALTTPNANPVVADASGVFSTIYLDPSIIYKLTLKTSADVLIYTVDPVNDQVLTSASIGALLYPRSAAEISASVTPTNYAINYEIVERYGAIGNDVANDNAAFVAAFAVAAVSNPASRNLVKGTPGKLYYIGSSTLTIPDNVILDTTAAAIHTTAATGIKLGVNSTWQAPQGFLTTSGAAGIAVTRTDPTASNFCSIIGFPRITPTTMGTVGSFGLDITGGYKAVWEINIEGYETNVIGGTSSVTPPTTYYNEFRSPKIRCTSGVTGMKFLNGCNATVILNPQISGANVATYGIHCDQAGSLTVLGGYVEAFAAANGTRGCRIANSTNISIIGVTFDQTNTDVTTSTALEMSGTSEQCNFYGNGFGGGWATSTKIMTKSGAGLYNFIGGAPTNQVCIIGLATWAGSYTNGFTSIGNLTAGAISASSSVAAGYAHNLINTADGQGALVQNNSANKTNGRSTLTLNRAGGPGWVVNYQDNGSERGGIVFCTGTPEGQITAPVSTLACRTDGGAATCLYVKETGTGNTGWVAK